MVRGVGKTSRRTITIYASSEAEGKKTIKALMNLASTETVDENGWKISDKKSTGKKQKPSTKKVSAFKVMLLDNTKAKRILETQHLKWKDPNPST